MESHTGTLFQTSSTLRQEPSDLVSERDYWFVLRIDHVSKELWKAGLPFDVATKCQIEMARIGIDPVTYPNITT